MHTFTAGQKIKIKSLKKLIRQYGTVQSITVLGMKTFLNLPERSMTLDYISWVYGYEKHYTIIRKVECAYYEVKELSSVHLIPVSLIEPCNNLNFQTFKERTG